MPVPWPLAAFPARLPELCDVRLQGPLNIPYSGTVAFFIGYNTYIASYTIHDDSIGRRLNGDRPAGIGASRCTDQPLIPGDPRTGAAGGLPPW